MIDKAVILAAGSGSRMRQADPSVTLSPQQAEVAETGIKALMPVPRPFVDYLLGYLAEAGFRKVCLVVAPQHDQLREYLASLIPNRIELQVVVQPVPLGTANALMAAEPFVGHDLFAVLNSDNLYPLSALNDLRAMNSCGLIGYVGDVLAERGNISADQVIQFAAVETDPEGFLVEIVEKPSPELLRLRRGLDLVSMNCWAFGSAMFTACRKIPKSTRGEYELPAAVKYSMNRLGQRYRVLRSCEPVWNLSSRPDVAAVEGHLAGVQLRL